MNITDALYHAVHNYPGGAEALALRMNISASSLQHKVNPNYPKAHCSPEEMAMICEMTSDNGALIAFAARVDCVVFPMPITEIDAGDDLMVRVSNVCSGFGHLISEVGAGIADGDLTDNELARVETGMRDLMRAVHDMHTLLQAVNRRTKPVGRDAPV